MIKITENQFWNAINFSSNYGVAADCLDFIKITYLEDCTKTKYQVNTDAHEYVIVCEYNDDRENKYYGTK